MTSSVEAISGVAPELTAAIEKGLQHCLVVSDLGLGAPKVVSSMPCLYC